MPRVDAGADSLPALPPLPRTTQVCIYHPPSTQQKSNSVYAADAPFRNVRCTTARGEALRWPGVHRCSCCSSGGRSLAVPHRRRLTICAAPPPVPPPPLPARRRRRRRAGLQSTVRGRAPLPPPLVWLAAAAAAAAAAAGRPPLLQQLTAYLWPYRQPSNSTSCFTPDVTPHWAEYFDSAIQARGFWYQASVLRHADGAHRLWTCRCRPRCSGAGAALPVGAPPLPAPLQQAACLPSHAPLLLACSPTCSLEGGGGSGGGAPSHAPRGSHRNNQPQPAGEWDRACESVVWGWAAAERPPVGASAVYQHLALGGRFAGILAR